MASRFWPGAGLGWVRLVALLGMMMDRSPSGWSVIAGLKMLVVGLPILGPSGSESHLDLTKCANSEFGRNQSLG